MTVVVILSAGAEWCVAREMFAGADVQTYPFGEYFSVQLAGRDVVLIQGGWGKISAAASAQYALARWSPDVVVNLGTCGGFAGLIERGTVILAEQTLVYDIVEQMGDPQAAIDHYSVALDLSYLKEPYPHLVRRGLLVSADRDICPVDIPMLHTRFGAVAADWESGAIAWVCARNNTRCLILRGVSDLVSEAGGEAYQAMQVFQDGARRVMQGLLADLPDWLACCG
jgi:adenosylhomocysteine nucleosidase